MPDRIGIAAFCGIISGGSRLPNRLNGLFYPLNYY